MCTKLLLLMVAFIYTSIPCTNGRNYMEEKPAFFKACHSKDSEFAECYKQNLHELMQNYKNGIPGLKSVGAFDPARVKRMKIALNELRIDLRNVSIQHLSQANITKIIYNPKNLTFLIRTQVPNIRVDANYKTKGRIMYVPVNSKGTLWLEIENSEYLLLFKMKLVDDEATQQTFIELQSVKSKIRHITDMHLQLLNLFNGNALIEDYVNGLLNENWQEIVEVLKPTMEDAINAVLYTQLKKVLEYIPAKYLIADIPTAKEFLSNIQLISKPTKIISNNF